MSDTDDKHCLFFDALGNGPSDVRLIERQIREVVEDGEIIVPRAYGLCWEVTGPLHFVEDGGFMLDAAAVDWLIAKLTAWRDAPRLAARRLISSCVVIDVDYSTGAALIKSTAGEWGVIDSDGLSHAPGWLEATGPQPDWYATEAEGRAAYRGETGKVSCESCAKFIDHDAATVDDEGIYTCADVSTCGAGIITEATP